MSGELEQLKRQARGDLYWLTKDAYRCERERGACSAFLRILRVPFDEGDLVCPPQDSPVDVTFRDARFQVTELLEPLEEPEPPPRYLPDRERRKRTEEILAASKVEDLLKPYQAGTPLTVNKVVPKVAERLRSKQERLARELCSELDALVYVNRPEYYGRAEPLAVDVSELEAQGWRSVSVLLVPVACVLLARREAPAFLRAVAGLVQECTDAETLWSLFGPAAGAEGLA